MKTYTYIDNILACDFITTITKPTRVTEHSATFIDHIYTNKVSSPYETWIIITDVADHFGTYYIDTNNSKQKSEPTSIPKRIYSAKNIDRFNQILTETDFASVTYEVSPHIAYDIISEKIKIIHNQAFPLKIILTNKRQRHDPWITEAHIKASKIKAKLYKTKLKNITETNCVKYESYNSKWINLRGKAKSIILPKQWMTWLKGYMEYSQTGNGTK